jgi:hypothetical protein
MHPPAGEREGMAVAQNEIETAPRAEARRERVAIGLGALVVALGSAILYLRTLGAGLGGTIDSAEFQHAAYNLSIVHPTGYPKYLLLGRLWLTLLPVGEVAWRMNLLSAVFAVAALMVVYATVVYLSRSVAGGVFAAALLGTHALVWETAVVAEVNSLNLLLVGASLYALLRWAGVGAGRRWLLESAALCYGLALAHHRTSLLLAPAIAIFVIWIARQGTRITPATAARCLALLLLPWLFYLYLPLRAATTPWYTNTWANFSAEVGGASAWPVILDTIQRPLLPRVGLVWGQVFPRLVGLGTAGLAGAGLVLWARLPRAARRPGLTAPVVLLYGLGFLTICGVMVVYDVDVIGDYLALAVLLAATWAGVAAGWLLAAVRGIPRLQWRGLPAGVLVAGLVLLALPAAQVRANYAAADFSHLDERALWDTLAAADGTPQALPKDAILIGGWAHYNELRYRQTVEGWRPDLVPVVLDDLVAGGHLNLIDEWLAQGRGVFLVDPTPDITDHFATVQQGPLARVTKREELPAVAMEHPLDITFGDNIHLLGYTLQPAAPRAGGQLRITLFWRTDARLQERYVVFTHLVDEAVHKIGQKDDEPVRGYRPTVNWAPGETVVDTLVMPIDPAAAPGTYRLVVGLYTRFGERRLLAHDATGQNLGDYWEMTPVRVTR